MTQFEQFKQKFWANFNDVSDFTTHWPVVDPNTIFNFTLVEEDDDLARDSYGAADFKYNRVYLFPDYGDLYVRFTGSFQSYGDEEWNRDFKEVKPATKEVFYFKEI